MTDSTGPTSDLAGTEKIGDARIISPYVENVCEATAACLFTMVQGNVLLLGFSHILVASQTGIIAGVLATMGLWMTKTDKPWVISLVLGIITAVVDFIVHPGMFGGVVTEAIVTGIAAGLLSYSVAYLLAVWRRRRAAKTAH